MMINLFKRKNKIVIIKDFKSLNCYLVKKINEWDFCLANDLINMINEESKKYELDILSSRKSFESTKAFIISDLIQKYNNSEIEMPTSEDIEKIVYEKLMCIKNFNIRKKVITDEGR
jgi:hypothetical protein